MFVIAYGYPLEKLMFTGPFETKEKACEWASNTYQEEFCWTWIKLVKPEEEQWDE